jgi:hypothetical protein
MGGVQPILFDTGLAGGLNSHREVLSSETAADGRKHVQKSM